MEQPFKRTHPLGSDFRGFDDLTPGLSMVSGEEVLAQDTWKMLNTPKGSLFWDKEAGWSSFRYLNAPLSNSAQQMAREIEMEGSKDKRYASFNAKVSLKGEDRELAYEIEVKFTSQTGGTYTFIASLEQGEVPSFMLVT